MIDTKNFKNENGKFMDYELREKDNINSMIASSFLPCLKPQKAAMSSDRQKIFATISKQCSTLQDKRILEFITLKDYKKLAERRLKTYVIILLQLIELDSEKF